MLCKKHRIRNEKAGYVMYNKLQIVELEQVKYDMIR